VNERANTVGDGSTTASIQSDAFDLPEFDQGTESPNSRIDFSIGLRLSDQDERGLFRWTSAANPTLHAPTRFVPTTVHDEDGEHGYRRVTRVARKSEQFAQLCDMSREPREKLGLCLAHAFSTERCLDVQGHDWNCLFFEGRLTHARVHRSYSVGSTENVVGAHAVVVALQYLMEWSQNEYRPWFDKMILQPLLAKAS
jgi:hypothetical protein